MSEWMLTNIGLLATPTGSVPARGHRMGEVALHRDAAIHVRDGVVAGIYSGGRRLRLDIEEVDAGQRLVTPGLIDAHTHLVFGGYRQHEVQKRLQGADYLEILKSGGGILDTVRSTRAASEQILTGKSQALAVEMLARGVTCCEIKSGYGLDIDTEMKQLRVARELSGVLPLDVRTTFLGAHAVPEEFGGRADDYVAYLLSEVIPEVAKSGLADFCDVFCERGVFDIGQSRAVLECARRHGLKLKLHADELEPMGGAQLAASLNATSADHLIAADDGGLDALSNSDTVAVLLPQTSLYLDKPFARARRMIGLGIPVALATDFNPGSCPSNNLHLSMNLGFIKYRMTPEEILTAVTLNAACAISMGESAGTLEPGKQADFVVWDADDLAMLCYRMGTNLAKCVVKRGMKVGERAWAI